MFTQTEEIEGGSIRFGIEEKEIGNFHERRKKEAEWYFYLSVHEGTAGAGGKVAACPACLRSSKYLLKARSSSVWEVGSSS